MAVKLHNSFAIHPRPRLGEQAIKAYEMTVSRAADHLKVIRSA